MVRRERLLAAALIALSAAPLACKKSRPAEASALAQISASEPNERARKLRAEMESLTASGKLEDAAQRAEPLQRAVGDLLAGMDAIHHKKTAVPDFGVVRYIEALRDLGESLRGFEKIYSPRNPESLKREMLQGLLDQLRQKIR